MRDEQQPPNLEASTAARFHLTHRQLDDHWISEWAADDPFAAQPDGGVVLSVPHTRWLELGAPPPDGADPELVDVFCAQHASASRLIGVAAQRIAIEPIGHVGAPELSFVLSVDGIALVDAAEPTPLARDGAGAARPLVPAAFVAYQRVCRWNARRQTTRPEQLVFLGELREHLERAAALLGASAVPFAFELAPHLREFRIEQVGRVALGWKPSKHGAVFDLELEQVQRDGTRARLDLRKLDPDSPIVALSATEHLLLDPEIDAVARVARKQVNKLRKHVEPHLASPATLLPEGLALDGVDLSAYSPRVVGFAPIVKAERFVDIRSSGTEWYQRDANSEIPFLRLFIAQPAGGGIETVSIATPEEAERAVATLEQALAQASVEAVPVGDRRVTATQPLVERIKEDLATFHARGAGEPEGAPPAASLAEGSGRLAAVIADEPDGAAAAEPDEPNEHDGHDGHAPAHAVPWSALDELLAPGVQLKAHQRAGLAWLWGHYQRRAPGVLLADDMGLGKTLQLAAFLALQRAGEPPEPPRAPGPPSPRAPGPPSPRAPSLIVCPVILLENWRAELRRFFRPEVFASLIVLYGDGLRRHKRGDTLELDAIAGASYVLTNYETLQAHQRSLLTLDWGVVVLDEGHAIKNPDTYRARAARGLKRRFGICSTGTPVENRLSDLWGLYDFLSPGDPFSTLKSFEQQFEAELEQGIAKVRGELRFPGPRSTLLRRTKAEVLELPAKTAVVHRVPMTPQQIELERSITGYGEHRGGALRVLQDLQKLYQHPRLLLPEAERESIPLATALDESPKLALCVQILREIRAAGEKALVFTLWTAMQELLAEVLRAELGLARVTIINGEPSRRAAAIQRIAEFSATGGFDVMVLSPLAAGTGLTITAANHVIHYGRWWNPAKEDQATDRAYRIGQTRPVRVHYPLLTHPANGSLGFDVKLHELVEKKRGMARDFLAPQAHDVTAGDLAELAGPASPASPASPAGPAGGAA